MSMQKTNAAFNIHRVLNTIQKYFLTRFTFKHRKKDHIKR